MVLTCWKIAVKKLEKKGYLVKSAYPCMHYSFKGHLETFHFVDRDVGYCQESLNDKNIFYPSGVLVGGLCCPVNLGPKIIFW